ncbi:MAG: lipocalin family protein, partial [Burkholderiales bacterium]
CGINLERGGALMAFRIRTKDGGVLYAGGTLKTESAVAKFTPAEITFTPLRSLRSPRTSVEYPVAMRVTAGTETWDLEPLMNDQELDSRASTGAIYWEGAVRAMQGGKQAGRGYLELTGYWKPLQM